METISSEQNNPDPGRIAFFDLDRTITRAVSGRLLVTGAYTRGLMKTRDLLKALWLSSAYRLNLRDPVSVMSEMIKWVEGIQLSEFENLCLDISDKALFPSVYREAALEFESYKENNVPIVLLSSSVCQICRLIAGHLGMDDFICTRLEVSDNRLTGRPLGSLCYGEEKARRLNDYCENRKIPPANSWYYGDSISDLPALLLVGNPVCINPDRKLEREARSRGWKVCSWQVSVN